MNEDRQLENGIYAFGKGKTRAHIYVKDGVCYLSTKVLPSPLFWLIAGKPILVCGKKSFMRAADVIEQFPSYKKEVEEKVKELGLTL